MQSACSTWLVSCHLKLSSNWLLQEDFEMAVAKVMKKDSDKNMSLRKLFK